jgi:hypothetical protein
MKCNVCTENCHSYTVKMFKHAVCVINTQAFSSYMTADILCFRFVGQSVSDVDEGDNVLVKKKIVRNSQMPAFDIMLICLILTY